MRQSYILSRGVVAITGKDRHDFLQNIITNNLDNVKNNPIHAGLLSPQGKLLFGFIIYDGLPYYNEAYLLDCAQAATTELVERLQVYKLRAEVEIKDVSDKYCVSWTPDLQEGSADPRHPALGARRIIPASKAYSSTHYSPDQTSYHIQRISVGVAELHEDFDMDEIFPHEANLDILHGIDFEKGCFVGQEVVSRMQHRGTARSRYLQFLYNGRDEFDRIHSDEAIIAGETQIGKTGSSYLIDNETKQFMGLALIRLDRLTKAKAENLKLFAEGKEITTKYQDWLAKAIEPEKEKETAT